MAINLKGSWLIKSEREREGEGEGGTYIYIYISDIRENTICYCVSTISDFINSNLR